VRFVRCAGKAQCHTYRSDHADCHLEEADDSRRVQSAAEAAAENMRLIAAL